MNAAIARSAIALLAASVALSLTSAAGAQAIPKRVEVKVAPSRTHQKCMMLNPPQKLSYDFNANDKVNFQIRYLKRETTYFPVKRERVTEGSDVFVPSTQDEYCLLWENRGAKEVNLSYSLNTFK
jgi:hypothetical protein